MIHRACVVVAFAVLASARCVAAWQAPPNAEPRAVLSEAKSDAQAGRYEDALAKHLWFHNHTLNHQSPLSGVRLSAALTSWYELGKKYPPAMEKLKETRDEAAARVLQGKGDVRDSFRDMVAINDQLGEETRTVTIFERLDKESPKTAMEEYDLAQQALLKSKNFALCGKYLQPEKSLSRMLLKYRSGVEIADKEKDERFRDYSERSFLDEAANLIALLVLNDRKTDAEKIAKEASSTSKHPAKKAIISSALQGKLPEGLIEH